MEPYGKTERSLGPSVRCLDVTEAIARRATAMPLAVLACRKVPPASWAVSDMSDFSYANYLHNYYNYFLPAYYSSVGYGKRSINPKHEPVMKTAEATSS
ncbi:hypothetical protein Tcan_07262 [Toxocara canis]|uniref:Uncharacterized protein n=1 Tax=Toxocara canis TaxID=6265 RepID=A0A0B2UUB5_TOXCA|nr:hypothetical protein Tcan_07262 [Toxocara canis]